MITQISPLLTGKAINTSDPKNISPYVYTYQSLSKAQDFQLTYFSETQNQAIILRSTDVQKYLAQDQAQQRDTKRVNDLQQIASALNLYSTDKANPNNPTQHVFPPQATWKQELAPKYLAIIPVDPLSAQDYIYTVTIDNSTYALQVKLEAPPIGKNTFLCTQDSCDYN